MKRKAVWFAAVLLCAGLASAQSLGDVARQQREAKKNSAARVVTNDDLLPAADIGDAAKLDLMLKALRSEDAKTRTAMMLAIWQTSQQKDINLENVRQIVPGIADAVLDRNLNIRYMAASSLKGFAPVAQPAIPALIQALNTFPGGSPALEGPERYYADARSAAAEALGAIGPDAKESIAALTKALKDPSPDVRQAAGAALKQIRGK